MEHTDLQFTNTTFPQFFLTPLHKCSISNQSISSKRATHGNIGERGRAREVRGGGGGGRSRKALYPSRFTRYGNTSTLITIMYYFTSIQYSMITVVQYYRWTVVLDGELDPAYMH